MAMQYFHSAMAGAPAYPTTAGDVPGCFAACLVTGFNVQSPSSAVVSDGVLTLNYPSVHGYEPECHIALSGFAAPALNGVFQVTAAPAQNQLTIALPAGVSVANGTANAAPAGNTTGTPGALSTKVAPLGWTEPFAPTAGVRTFCMGGGNQRYLRLSAEGGVVKARGYESMSAVSTGIGAFPAESTAPLEAAIGFMQNNDVWAIFGTNRYFYFVRSAGGKSYYMGAIFFGDLAHTSADPIPESTQNASAYADPYSTALLCAGAGGVGGIFGGNIISATNAAAPVKILAADYAHGAPNRGPAYTPTAPHTTRLLYGVPVYENTGPVRGLLPGAWSALWPGNVSAGFPLLLPQVQGVSGRLCPVPSPHYYNHSTTEWRFAVALDQPE